ncbi:MAG: TraR/DksA C4-type zinc finger protein [Nitrospirae bacterium]|nr:TraR/DksA C4-type zinc finger protein [Nitrospirota bacterium]
MATKTKKTKKAQNKDVKKAVKKKVSKPASKTRKPIKAKKIKAPAKSKPKKPVKIKETPDQKKEDIKKFLIEKRKEIVREAKAEISKYIKGETKQLVDTALDDGDWAVVDLTEDISFRQLAIHREMLVKVDTALSKLAEGTYGICEECGDEISEQRLKVLPFAVYCRDCQEKIEQLEAIEKEIQR